MKKIVGGKRYDTDTATLVGEYVYGNRGDFEQIQEGLYRTKNGNYFVAGSGGPKTRYAIMSGQNCWSGSSDIYPLTQEEAFGWAQENLSTRQVEREFGDQVEDA